MKKCRYILNLVLFLLLLLLLSDPASTLMGAKNGLLLWYNGLLPSLLPFVILSGLLTRLGGLGFLNRVFSPILSYFPPLTGESFFPLTIGMLAGLPMGAGAVADGLRKGRLNRTEAHFLFSSCNNPSPAFILSFTAAQVLDDPDFGPVLLLIIILSSFISSYILFFRFRREKPHESSASFKFRVISRANLNPAKAAVSLQGMKPSSLLQNLDSSIVQSVSLLVKLGCYLMLFSILALYMAHFMVSFLKLPEAVVSAATGMLEITAGLSSLQQLEINMSVKKALASAILSFGGFSGLAQVQSVTAESGLSVKYYICTKILSTVTAVILTTLFT